MTSKFHNKKIIIIGSGFRAMMTAFYCLKKSSDEFKMRNLGLFQNRINLMRILFMNELYQKTINVTGDIMEFGCRWGQNLSLFLNFRGIYEPYNMQKKMQSIFLVMVGVPL